MSDAPERIWAVVGQKGTRETLMDVSMFSRGEFHSIQGTLYGENVEYIRADLSPDTSKCRKCGAGMNPGKALAQTYVGGMPDFPGETHSSTFSAGGPGEMVDCLKCLKCGWSVTAPDTREG